MAPGRNSWEYMVSDPSERMLQERGKRLRAMILVFAVLYALAIGGTIWMAFRVLG